VGGEVRRAVPALKHRRDREAGVLANGAEPALVDEGINLGLVEFSALDVDPHSVAGEEEVGRVPVELGALVRTKGIFDGELVQAQLGRELVELLLRGSAQVHPHDGVGLVEALRDIGEGEPLRLKNPLSIHPGHGIAHEDSPPAPMGACVAPSSSLDYPPSVARRSGRAKQQSVVRQVCSGTDPVPELRQGERAPRSAQHDLQEAAFVLHHEPDGMAGNPRLGCAALPYRTEPGPIGSVAHGATTGDAIEESAGRPSRPR
jgi:hypothetical protein